MQPLGVDDIRMVMREQNLAEDDLARLAEFKRDMPLALEGSRSFLDPGRRDCVPWTKLLLNCARTNVAPFNLKIPAAGCPRRG